MNHRKTYAQRQLDFEIGYLIKSPCKSCGTRYQFPGCITGCDTLDRIQTRLAQSISSTRAFSPLEPFSVQLERQKEK